MKTAIYLSILAAVVLVCSAFAHAQTKLLPDRPEQFTLKAKEDVEFSIDLKVDELCNVTSNALDEMPILLYMYDPSGKELVKDTWPSEGHLFVAEAAGRYRVIFRWQPEFSFEKAAEYNGRAVTVRYSNKFVMPKNAAQKATRTLNGYQAKIFDEPGDDTKSYLVIQKGGKIRGLMRESKAMTGGLYFADDPKEAGSKAALALYRTTPDKTGDGTPDIAVEYYTGGAHCCYEITFFELGDHVRSLPTIDTGNDRLTPVSRLPHGGLRYSAAEQAFCYWAINYASSPQPGMIWQFNKDDELVPRFDLMRKRAPSLAKIKNDAAAAKRKINLNPYTSPEDNFNDFEEPFWDEMLDLIYTGHEDLAWQYFDLVWPERKPGKEKFLSDFKEQLALTAYGDYKKMPKPTE